MAPITSKTITAVEDKQKYQISGQKQNDVSKFDIGAYLSGNKAPKRDYLRELLDKINEYNDHIKAEIAECRVEIKETRKELNALERMFKDADNVDEKASLKSQISELKSEHWRLIISNCKRAWSLRSV